MIKGADIGPDIAPRRAAPLGRMTGLAAGVTRAQTEAVTAPAILPRHALVTEGEGVHPGALVMGAGGPVILRPAHDADVPDCAAILNHRIGTPRQHLPAMAKARYRKLWMVGQRGFLATGDRAGVRPPDLVAPGNGLGTARMAAKRGRAGSPLRANEGARRDRLCKVEWRDGQGRASPRHPRRSWRCGTGRGA